MSKTPTFELQDAHKYFAAHCFNKTWDFIDKQSRTAEEVDQMIQLCLTSLWHWSQRTDATPKNFSVGYWQASRVNALAGLADTADWFARRCLKLSVENQLPPFYIGYAHEAMARASLVHGARARAREHLRAAGEELARVTDTEERELMQNDLSQLEKTIAENR